jgi:cysteine desulfurase/selenocysteine lyase
MMSNALGTIVPVKEVCAIARLHGVATLVDGAQAAVHLDVDVQDIGCDFFVMTGHKLYGPSGIGVLWGRKALLDILPPFLGGGEMIRVVTEDTVTYNEAPHRFEAGTPPLVQAIGLGEAIRYIDAVGKPAIRAHEDVLVKYAHEKLGEINSIRIIGKAKRKSSVVSFAFENAHAHDVATVIDRHGVAVRAGTHCTMPLLARFGVTATCRASFGMYNTLAEVDALAAALRKAENLFG